MSFTSALPANLIKFSLPLARFISVSDTATTVEIATRADAVLIASDSALGFEVRLSPLLFTSTDLASGIDTIVERLVELFDTGIGTEVIIRTLTLTDTATGEDLFKELVPHFLLSDTATGEDQIAFTVLEFIASDSALGFEVRLSPLLFTATDTALGIDTILRKDMRFIADLASGIDTSILELMLIDSALTEDISILERVITDSALGFEVRLSPIPVSVIDAGLGEEISILPYAEFLASDLASGIDTILRKDMRFIADTSTGTEVTLFERLLTDIAMGDEAITFLSRTFLDSSTGFEIRLSPLFFTATDLASGIETAFFTLLELILTDEATSIDRLISKSMIITDSTTVVESAFISLSRIDSAVARDTVIRRLVSLLDSALGFEVRLSPIPVSVIDAGAGEEIVTDRLIQLLDNAITEEPALVTIFIPPIINSLQSSTSTSIIYTGSNIRILMEMLSSISTILVRSYTVINKTLPSSITTNTLYNILYRPSSSVYLSEIISLSQLTTQTPFIFRSVIRYEGMDLLRNILHTITLYTLKVIDLIIRLDLTYLRNVSAFRRTIRREGLDVYYLTSMLSDSVTILSVIFNKLTSSILTAATAVPIHSLSIDQFLVMSLPTVLLMESLAITITSIHTIYAGLSHILLENPSLLKEIIEYVAAGMGYTYHDVHIEPILVSETLLHAFLTLIYGISYQSCLLADIFTHRLGFIIHLGVLYRELTSTFMRGIMTQVRETTTAYRHLKRLQDAILQYLRYVSTGDPVLPRDNNAFVDLLLIFINFAETLTNEIFPDDPLVNRRLQELRDAHSRLRRVKSFDIVVSRDHNRIIDTIVKAREFLRLLHDKVSAS